ncbi:MAG: hypothetical protein Q9227_001652 [Pyrenula ochraceoflavens]
MTTTATLPPLAPDSLSILKLTSQIFSPASPFKAHSSQQQRPSDASTASSSDAADLPTPASLAADLSHYKDLFTKLHFSYLEQVTKEKYLRSIVGDPPLLVSNAENVELEGEVNGQKAALKGKKVEVEDLQREIEGLGRELVERWEKVQGEWGRMEELPGEIEGCEGRVGELKERIEELEQGEVERRFSGAGMDLGLAETLAAGAKREEELVAVEREIEALRRKMPGKERECEVVERELEGLERRKNDVCRLAGEERRRREEGGRDRVEEAGRWWRGVEGTMKGFGLSE